MREYRRTHGGKDPPVAKTPSVSGNSTSSTATQQPAATPKRKRPAGSQGSSGAGNDALLNYLLGSGG
jgi:hypothetical protein